MKLSDFRVDARRKMLRDREVFDYMAMGWQVVPQVGQAACWAASASNFPHRHGAASRQRLAMGLGAASTAREIRHPDSNALHGCASIEYLTQTRGLGRSPRLDHDNGHAALAAGQHEPASRSWQTTLAGHARSTTALLDELAKRICRPAEPVQLMTP